MKRDDPESNGHHTGETIEVPAVYGKTFQELSQKLLEAAPDAMLFVERGGRIALVNAQLEKLFGYSRKELIGKDLHMLIPERFWLRHRENIARFFEDPVTRPMGTGLKIYGRKKDGEEFRADISLSPLSIDGEILVTAAIRDITERVRTEEQIEFDYHVQKVISTILKIALEPISFEEQLDRTLELILSVPDPELEPKGLIYLFDRTTAEYILKAQSGFPEPAGSSIAFPEAFHPDGPACTENAKTEVSCEVTDTGNPDAPYQIIHRRIGSFIHYCIPIHEGQTILGLISIFAKEWPGSEPREQVFFRALSHTLAVIIKRYQSENERQQLIERLTQSEKMAALGRISANVAHEIRNPLTVVGGFARRLQRRAAGETDREYSNFIVSEVSRLEEILKSILRYAKTTTLRLKGYRVQEIIDEVLNMYEELYRDRSIRVRRSYAYSPEVLLDRDRAREVIVNIVSNALDAMSGGGTLTIVTGKAEINEGQFLKIGISDTGGGIPADRLDKIFEPFFTTKVSERGIGLGLSISKKTMEDHGGFITVESKPGEGTTFNLYFPLTHPPATVE